MTMIIRNRARAGAGAAFVLRIALVCVWMGGCMHAVELTSRFTHWQARRASANREPRRTIRSATDSESISGKTISLQWQEQNPFDLAKRRDSGAAASPGGAILARGPPRSSTRRTRRGSSGPRCAGRGRPPGAERADERGTEPSRCIPWAPS